MTPEHAFLRAIKEEPLDDGPRLIFADWLEENGQPERAQFLRLQVELARRPGDDPERPGLEAHQRQLLAEHGARWLGPWAKGKWAKGPWAKGKWEFRRGLLHIECHAAKLFKLLAANGEAALEWVEGLTLQVPRAKLRVLLDSPWLRHLTALDLSSNGSNGFGDAGAAALASSPHLAGLTALNLAGNNAITAAGAKVLASSPHLARLTTLDLGFNDIGDAGAAALASSPHLARLTALNLKANSIGEVGVAALASSPHLARLTTLNLKGTTAVIRREALEVLRARFGSVRA
jgi:uncharacterized protein (TIGR02996 family)